MACDPWCDNCDCKLGSGGCVDCQNWDEDDVPYDPFEDSGGLWIGEEHNKGWY